MKFHGTGTVYFFTKKGRHEINKNRLTKTAKTGIIYLCLPVDLIPPILFPFGFLDDLVLWAWILWHLKDTLDQYWTGESEEDISKNFDKKDLIEDVEFTVDQEEEE